MWVAALLVCLGLLHQYEGAVVNTIKWSNSYTVKAVLTIPSANLTVPYQVWNNGETQRSRVDFYGGLNKMYRQWDDLSKTFEYFKIHLNTTGKTDEEVCDKIPSTAAEIKMYTFNTYLPVKPWTYVGLEKLNNFVAQKFIYERLIKLNEKTSAKEIYTLWIIFKNDTAVPLRFVYEQKDGNKILMKYCHDYSYFDGKEPDVQTLLIPLGMQCNPLANTLIHGMEVSSKYGNLDYLQILENSPEFLRSSTVSYASVGSFQWSKSYTLKAVLTVPAANITEPYQVWLDGDTGKSRVDFYGGMDKLFRKYDDQNKKYRFYKIYPVTNVNMGSKEVCNEVDATAPEVKVYALNTYLPIKRWTYVGNEHLNNVETKKFVYEYSVKIKQKDSGKVVYTVWVNFKGGVAVPVRFVYELKGETKVLDNFRHDYTYFDATKPDDSILEKPLNMKCNIFPVESFHEPIDPLMEYIEPNLEHSRVVNAFDRFKTKHNKIYTNEDEYFKRMNIFKDNLRFINSFNRQHRSFNVGVNKLADLSKEEMGVFLGTVINDNNSIEQEGSGDFEDDEDDNIEDDNNDDKKHTKFDWRDYGAITPVKDQTTICSGCYAFTTAAAIESSAYIARGCKHLDEVSEQAIIDCTWWVTNYGNLGCAGGLYEYALKWVYKHGIPLKSEYGSYLAMEGRCHAKDMNKLVKINGYNHLKRKKQVIKSILRENGPLLASLDSKHLSFTFYSSGIYDEPECSNDAKNRTHGVAIVGYGREHGMEYWTLKNSYGKDWGENGYMRIAQARNLCGLKNDVYTVNFNKSFNCTLPLNFEDN